MIKIIFNTIFLIFIAGLILSLAGFFTSTGVSNTCTGDLLSCLDSAMDNDLLHKITTACQCIWHNIVCVFQLLVDMFRSFIHK